MNTTILLAKRFVADEQAAEVTELGIVLALIVAGCVVAIGVIGPIIKKAYEDTANQLTPAAGS